MSFADFQDSVPPLVRLALALAIAIGLSVLLVHLFHRRILAINAPPAPKANDTDPDPPPSVRDLGGRLIALVTFAFVFLLGFGFGQFWSTAKDARDATMTEAIDYQRAVGLAQRLPGQQSAALLTALDDYRSGIVTIEWPLMETADANALATARYAAAEKLGEALYENKTSQDSSNPEWAKFTDSVDDLLSDAIDRTNALPGQMAVSIILLVFILGIANLVAIALFQPSEKKSNLVVVAMMAGITGFLLFVLVEISNPYNGAGAVTSQLLQR